jgi:hypothetical protein
MPKRKTSDNNLSADDLVQALKASLSINGTQPVTVTPEPQPPAPEKLRVGGDFERWESKVRSYLEFFAPPKRLYILHSLLDDDLYDLLRHHRNNPTEVNDEAFETIRTISSRNRLPREYRHEFHNRVQKPQENAFEY